jgi:hypothetical protein
MTEKDLLFRLENICRDYRDINEKYWEQNDITLEQVNQCLVYISSKIRNRKFNRDDRDEWNQVKTVLYERLEKKSPQTMFELTLGLPEGCGTVILDEVVYGRMYQNDYREVGLRK